MNLTELAQQMHRDSSIWFPVIHNRGHDATVRHYVYGVGGEAGEVLDVMKKADICGFVETCSMHADGKHSTETLASEMADVLTYLLALAHVMNIDIEAAYEAKRLVNIERWGATDELA